MKIVIIGGGPGGYVAAIRAAQLGAAVTLVENKYLGGTCLNVGCIPTKVLLHTSELLDLLKNDAKELGITISDYHGDWPKLQKRKTKIIKKLVGGVNGLLKNNGITQIMGTAVFVNKHQIKVISEKQDQVTTGSQVIDFDFAIIATGSKPVIPPIPGSNHPDVITSDTALSLDAVPASLGIIGGGVIGCEFASIYNAFGCKVTIIEMLPEIVANMDADIVKPLKAKLQKDGVEIFTGTRVESIQENPDGLAITTSSPAGEQIITVAKVLLSVGRKA